jgi:hypothetical protein
MPVVILVEGTVEVMPEVEEVVAASSREVVWAVVDAVTVAQVMVDRVGEETVGQVTGMEIDQAVVTTVVETTAVALAVRVASVATTPVGNRPKHALGRPQTSKP